ncbi:MAG: tape measure protein [Pseudonocardiaceae bacterium]|nr:tape measure protein [Pseudonocardiaceae bacterium]
MAFQVGTAYVQVTPSLRGMQKSIQRGMTPIAGGAGKNLSTGIGKSAAAAAPAAMLPVQRTITQRIGGATRTAASNVSRSFATMGKSATASMAGATGAAAGMSGQLRSMAKMAGGLAAAVGLFQLGRSAVQSAVDLEKSQAALTGLYGDADKARGMLKRLREIGRGSPIELSAFVQGAESLAYMGFEGDQAITVLKSVETAMVGSGRGGESFNQVTEAMLAMVNQGKATAEELNRMSQAGFPAWETLADQMGVSIEQVREMVTAGEIGINDVVAAMENAGGPTMAKLSAAQEEASKTLSATWARAKDNVVTSLGQMVAPLIQRLTPAISSAGSAITGAFSAAPRIFGRFKDAIVNSGVADAVRSIATGIWDLVKGAMPAIKGAVTTLGVVFGGLLLALAPVGDLLGVIGRWMQEHQSVVEALGAAVAGAALAFGGLLIVSKVATAIKATTLVTHGFRAAVLALNAAMRANLIGIIVTALGALVAGLIYAYKNSETFRNIVDGVFRAVATAGQWMWDTILKPVFDALVAGWNGLVTGIQSAWTNVLSPVFNFIGQAAKILIAIVLTILITPFILAWNYLSSRIMAGWNDLIKPAWDAVSAAAMWLWTNVLSPVFGWIGDGWNLLVAGIKWYWENVLRPVWNGLQIAAQWMWNNVLKPVFGWIGDGWNLLVTGIKVYWEQILKPAWNALQTAAQWMWNNVLKPVFDAIGKAWGVLGDGIRWVWDNVIKPAWDAVVGGLEWMRDKFRDIFNGIKDIVKSVWNGVIGLLGKGVNTVIRGVNWMVRQLNKIPGVEIGQIGLWDWGALRLARGGPVFGAGTATSDSIPARLSRGEHVWTAREVANAGGHEQMMAMRDAAARGTLRYFRDGGAAPGFAFGGAVDRALALAARPTGARVSSAYRPGDSGYHGRGKAVDLVGNLGAINSYIAQGWPNSTQLIYTPGTNLLNGRPHTYNPATRSQHYDHVHWAMQNLAMIGNPAIRAIGGAFSSAWDFMKGLSPTEWLDDLIGKVRGRIRDGFPKGIGQFADVGFGLLGQAWDGIKQWVLDKIGFAGGGGPVKDQVREVARGFGWGGGAQWDAIVELVQRESSWNPQAANPTSSARGLFQKMTSIHGPVEPTATGQAQWGLNYIQGRYGTPIGALAHHDRRNWYDRGGMLNGAGWFAKNTLQPERVLDPSLTRQFDTLAGLLSSGRLSDAISGDDGRDLQISYTGNFYGGDARPSFDDFAHKMRVLKRGGML